MSYHKVDLAILVKNIGFSQNHQHFRSVPSRPKDNHNVLLLELELIWLLELINFIRYVGLKCSYRLDDIKNNDDLRKNSKNIRHI